MKKGAPQGLRDLRQPAAQEPPKITFPCDYSLKVVGDAAEDFPACVCQVIVRHDPDFDATVRVVIRATGEQHIKELFEDLKATGRVHMVV